MTVPPVVLFTTTLSVTEAQGWSDVMGCLLASPMKACSITIVPPVPAAGVDGGVNASPSPVNRVAGTLEYTRLLRRKNSSIPEICTALVVRM